MKNLLILAALLAVAATQIAWTPVLVNDSGTMNKDGLVYSVYRGNGPYPHDFTSRRTWSGRNSRYFVHGVLPDTTIETLMIGDLRFNEFNPPCSDEDTLRGHFELCFSFGLDTVNCRHDFNSDPVASSPSISIPYTGITTRTFFSSLTRPQGNSWDNFVPAINELMHEGTPFVIRFHAEGQSGFMLNDGSQPFHLAYSLNLAEETDFLDTGDPRITCLSLAQAAAYQGLVVRGVLKREPWTSQRAIFNCYLPDGSPLATKQIAIPWQNEDATRELFCIGIAPEFMESNPRITIVANEYGEGVTTQCRADSLTAYFRP